jgi:2-amino-4-hydroxy-6-hydroxymethyldihydropteridine diphosphokinase
MPTVYIALGSNIGERENNLHEALDLLAEAGLKIKKVSSFYETEPVDYLDQAWFLNAVLEADTALPAVDLLQTLRAIETGMGSKKAFAKGPRLIDLDLLLYANESLNTLELQIPHPRMLDRRFVLVPLAEIAPNLKHPSWPVTTAELLLRTSDKSAVKKFQP